MWFSSALAWPVLARSRLWPAFSRCGVRTWRDAGRAVGRWPSGAPRPPTGCRHVGSGGRRSARVGHRKHSRCAKFGGATDVDRVARAGDGRPKRRGTPPGRTRPDHHGAHLDRHRSGCRHHTPISARSATDLGPGMLAGALAGGLLLRWVALAAPLWLAAVPYCWSPVPRAPTWRLAAHNRRPGGSPDAHHEQQTKSVHMS
jgi:hypothetical protein